MMDQYSILLPVFALVFLTFFIGMWLGKLRIAAVRKGELNLGFYRLNKGQEMPERMAQVSNNYDNLLSLPTLFYVLCILLFVMQQYEFAQVVLAWVFVLLRYGHSIIHTTYNNVRHRMRVFLGGVVVLLAMWVLLAVRVLSA